MFVNLKVSPTQMLKQSRTQRTPIDFKQVQGKVQKTTILQKKYRQLKNACPKEGQSSPRKITQLGHLVLNGQFYIHTSDFIYTEQVELM